MSREDFWLIVGAIAFVAVFSVWMWFFWTSCAFVSVADAPVLCLGSR